jgi:hypothetical protein
MIDPSNTKGWNTGTPEKSGWYWVCCDQTSVAMLAEWSGSEWTIPYSYRRWSDPVSYWVRVIEPENTPRIQQIFADASARLR